MKKREVFGVMSARGSGPTLVVFVFEFLFLGAPQPLPPSAAPQPLPPSAAPRPWPSCTGPWVPPKRGRPPPYPRGRRTSKPREVLRSRRIAGGLRKLRPPARAARCALGAVCSSSFREGAPGASPPASRPGSRSPSRHKNPHLVIPNIYVRSHLEGAEGGERRV